MQTVFIDLSNKNTVLCLHAMQGDTDRKIKIALYDGGVEYDASSDAVSVWYDNGTGNVGNFSDGIEKSGNKITITLNGNLTEVPGCYAVAVMLNRSNGKISTWNMVLRVDGMPGYGSEDAKKYFEAFQAGDLAAQIAAVNSRVSSIIASGTPTDGNTELIDIRTGYDGTVYKTAGDAVRSQVSNIHDIIKNIKLINVFDKSDITTGGYLRGTVGSDINSVVTLEGSFYCNQIWDVKEGDVIRTSHPYMGISIYDDNDKLILKFNDDLTEHTLPARSKKMRYSSTVTSANYLDNAMITINFEMPAEYVKYGLDSFPTYEDSQIEEAIKNLSGHKTAVILRFDGTGGIDFISDPRYSLVCEEFGYNCTISVGFSGGSMVTSAAQFQKLMKYGIDFGIYSNTNPPSLSVISGEDEESITACENYVREATEAAKTIGAYCPVTWLCRQSNSGYALEKALKKYGYMLASGIYYGDANTGLIEDGSKFTLQTSSLRPDTVDSVISKLNNAIENGYDIAVLTHGFYETEEEASANYSCTEENYREFLNAVKSYVEAGKAEVLTYSEYISKRKNNAVLRTKENQRIANWIFK